MSLDRIAKIVIGYGNSEEEKAGIVSSLASRYPKVDVVSSRIVDGKVAISWLGNNALRVGCV